MDTAEKSSEEYLFEITSFLVTSAKRCLGPEAGYGAGRLVQTLNLLSFLPDYVPELQGNSLLKKTREYIENDQQWWYEDKLNTFLDGLMASLREEMKARQD